MIEDILTEAEEVVLDHSEAGEYTPIEPGFENPYVVAVHILNKAFDHFNEKYCNNILKRPLITILSRGNKACLGWHWKDKWQYQSTLHTEIMVAAETLRRPIQEILETLLHEMVHLHNSQHDIRDCNSSQYHNKHFKKCAETIFHLEVDKMPQKGYAITRLSVKSRDDVQFFIDQEGIQDFRLVRMPSFVEGKGKPKQYMINVSEADYFWFQDARKKEEKKSKEFFADLRDLYTELEDNTELTGT